MKQLFLVVALLASFASSAQADPGTPRKRYLRPKKDENCQYVQNVTKNTEEESEIDGSLTRVAYRPYAELLTEIDELRKINHWADSTYQRRFNALAPGGVLTVTMMRKGPKNADPSFLTVAARTKDGKEVFTQQLTPGTGRFWTRDLYKSERTIPFVKTEQPQALQLTITDDKLKQQFEYVINAQ